MFPASVHDNQSSVEDGDCRLTDRGGAGRRKNKSLRITERRVTSIIPAMNQKPSEAGWFYHAPAKKTANTEPVGAPPASQIPGLGDVSALPPEKPKEMVFLDTDSKYIRLAKMGGRKDLLVIRPNSGTKREPRSYPRNDWFYLEDNAQQDKAIQSTDNEPWKFLLPDYMVHQSMGETTLPEESPAVCRQGVPMRPAPYATEQQSPRKGQLATTKPRKSKQQGSDVHMAKTSSRNKTLDPQVLDEPPCLKYQPLPAEQEEPTTMTKLLAYSYEREWHKKHVTWEEKQAKNQKKTTNHEQSEGDTKSSVAVDKSRRQQNPDVNNNHVLTTRKLEKEIKEPFKLSKFKKIPARLDTHRSTEVLTAKGK